jgi:hypothetical protein
MSPTDKRPPSPLVVDGDGENSDPISPTKTLRVADSSNEFDWYDVYIHD